MVKTAKNQDKTPNHGGTRSGAGRKKDPPIDYDEKFKKDVAKVLKKLKKKHGVDFLEVAFGMMYDDDTQSAVKASLFKTYKEIFATKKIDTNLKVSETKGPGIMLPQKKEDPADSIKKIEE